MDSIETAKIAAIVRCILKHMNLSKSDTDPEASIKIVGLPNEMRINMLLRKFSKNDHDLYLAYLLPLSPKDFTYEETIEKCGKVFGDNTSLFNRRFKCLNLAICEGEDIHKYAATVNRMCNAFSYGSLKEDQFRCLVFIQGLRSPCYAEIRLKLLSFLDKNPDIMLHHLVDEYNNFRSLIADSNMVESSETRAYQIKKPEINRVPKNRTPQPHPQSQPTNPK